MLNYITSATYDNDAIASDTITMVVAKEEGDAYHIRFSLKNGKDKTWTYNSRQLRDEELEMVNSVMTD